MRVLSRAPGPAKLRASKDGWVRISWLPRAGRSAQPSSSETALTARVSALCRLIEGASVPLPSSVSSSVSSVSSPLARPVGDHGEVDELVAGVAQRLRRLVLPEHVDLLARLAQPVGEAGEVAVAGDQRERLDVAVVQQVHRVDHEREVGGVLAGRVGVLVHRAQAEAVELARPLGEVRVGPVAVDAPDGRVAVLRDLAQHLVGVGRARVVGVDHHRDPVGGSVGLHACSLGRARASPPPLAGWWREA